jgi:hypothetical protein
MLIRQISWTQAGNEGLMHQILGQSLVLMQQMLITQIFLGYGATTGL